MAHPGDAHHNAGGLVVTRLSENYHPPEFVESPGWRVKQEIVVTANPESVPAMKETRPALPRRNLTREIKPTYWRKLIEAGVPIDAADAIAWAIARYNTARRQPPSSQQALIRQYCAFVCRAGLWRSQLLVNSGL